MKAAAMADATEVCRLTEEVAVLRRAASREWMPIETAPRDGTKVDLWVVWPNAPAERIANAWFSGNWWRMYSRGFDKHGFTIETRKITHWMPLPSPPVSP